MELFFKMRRYMHENEKEPYTIEYYARSVMVGTEVS